MDTLLYSFTILLSFVVLCGFLIAVVIEVIHRRRVNERSVRTHLAKYDPRYRGDKHV